MSEFEATREEFWLSIRQLKRQKTLLAIRQARQMLRDWMRQHPDDHSSQDAGEELWMMEEALEILEAENVAEPVAV